MTLSIRSLARIGAVARLEAIAAERRSITDMFPELRGGRSVIAGRSVGGGANGAGAAKPAAGRRRLSAAGRAAIIEGTRKRWAAWRKKQKKAPADAA